MCDSTIEIYKYNYRNTSTTKQINIIKGLFLALQSLIFFYSLLPGPFRSSAPFIEIPLKERRVLIF